MGFCAGHLPMVWALGATRVPQTENSAIHRDTLALIAPILVAANVQFAVWNAAGLENNSSVFCSLLNVALHH